MAIQLRLESDSSDHVASLHRWLRREQPVRTHGEIARARSDDPEHQGILIDVLTAVIGSGLSAAQLWIALRSWRGSITPPPALTITHVAADGSTTKIEAATEAAFVAAVHALEQRS
jgi:hypothetical protein